MPCSVVRSDRVVPGGRLESKAGSSSWGWVGQPPFRQRPPMLLCAIPSLFPSVVPEVLLLSQAQVKWDVPCLPEDNRSWEVQGSPIVLATGCSPQGGDVPALPGFSELDSPAQDLVQ